MLGRPIHPCMFWWSCFAPLWWDLAYNKKFRIWLISLSLVNGFCVIGFSMLWCNWKMQHYLCVSSGRSHFFFFFNEAHSVVNFNEVWFWILFFLLRRYFFLLTSVFFLLENDLLWADRPVQLCWAEQVQDSVVIFTELVYWFTLHTFKQYFRDSCFKWFSVSWIWSCLLGLSFILVFFWH